MAPPASPSRPARGGYPTRSTAPSPGSTSAAGGWSEPSMSTAVRTSWRSVAARSGDHPCALITSCGRGMPQPPQWRVRGSPACSNGCTGVQPPVRIGLLADCVGAAQCAGRGPGGWQLLLLKGGARQKGPRPSDGVTPAIVAGRSIELVTGCTARAHAARGSMVTHVQPGTCPVAGPHVTMRPAATGI